MRRSIASALSTTALAATATLAVSGTASAEPDWDELAQCESSGNWSTNTGNGYQGGLQFSDSTWDAYGGEEYASSAHQASREEQIAVGQRVLEGQGSGAWPGCSAITGWEGGGTSSSGQSIKRYSSEAVDSVRSAPTREETSHQVIVVPRQSVPTLDVKPKSVPPGGKARTVTRGDTLTSIAAKNPGVDWKAIHELNRDVVEHQDWIFPGEQLVIPAPTR